MDGICAFIVGHTVGTCVGLIAGVLATGEVSIEWAVGIALKNTVDVGISVADVSRSVDGVVGDFVGALTAEVGTGELVVTIGRIVGTAIVGPLVVAPAVGKTDGSGGGSVGAIVGTIVAGAAERAF